MILGHIKRKHNALYAMLVWMEPFGTETWCVWIRPWKGQDMKELSRSTSKWRALWKACKVEP